MKARTPILTFIIICLFVSLSGINAFAFDSPSLLEYSSDEDKITAYVNGLESNDAACRIAGIECPAIKKGTVYADAEEYQTLFLIDTSKSMSAYKDAIASFLLNCIDNKQSNEYYSIAVFGSANSPEYLTGFENDRYSLEKIVDNISYDYKSSYIFSNLHNAISELMSENTAIYKRIVLFTDGGENSAKGMTVDEVLSDFDNTPIQVYTVSLVNSSKNNIEQLKTIARIARASGGADIMISNNKVTEKNSEILFSDAADISCIEIQIDNTVADGSVKAVEITSGQTVIKADLRMPMLSAEAKTEETETETETEATASEQQEDTYTQISTEDETAPIETSPQKPVINLNFIIIIAAAVAVIAIIVAVVNTVTHRKNTAQSHASISDVKTDNDDTVIISSRSGDTEMLFNSSAGSVIILRDLMNTDHTFEASLSGGIIIGRSSDVSSLVIDYDKSVSKKHCRIYLKGNDVYIEDLGSANKTYVNDVQITSPQIIRNTDEIKIGRVRFGVTIK